MKTKFYLILIAAFISKFTFADVIIDNTHYVEKCVKITNMEDYPDVAFIGYCLLMGQMRQVNELSPTLCLDKGYRLNEFTVYAVNKSYLNGKDINKIDFRKDLNALPTNIAINPYMGFVYDSIPLAAIEEYYKVVGFSNTNVILYKWKQVTKYNNGKPDLIENFEYAEPTTPLYQKIMVGMRPSQKASSIEVYPNPANKNIHLRIIDNYIGPLSTEFVSSTGKVLKSFNLNKQSSILDCDIPVANVTKGAYFVKVQQGKAVEYKKIIIK
jgi:hypothetical protein